jgi:hypothetical protein
VGLGVKEGFEPSTARLEGTFKKPCKILQTLIFYKINNQKFVICFVGFHKKRDPNGTAFANHLGLTKYKKLIHFIKSKTRKTRITAIIKSV